MCVCVCVCVCERERERERERGIPILHNEYVHTVFRRYLTEVLSYSIYPYLYIY